MFGFLKNKLKSAVEKFTKKVEEEVEVVEEIEIEEKQSKEPSIKETFVKEKIEEEVQKKGFVTKLKEKVTTKKISEEKFEEIFQGIQIALLENNVALEVVDKIREDLKLDLIEKPIKRINIEAQVKEALKKSLAGDQNEVAPDKLLLASEAAIFEVVSRRLKLFAKL